METPNSLTEAIKFFVNPDDALRYLVAIRWPNGVTCPYCSANKPNFIKTRRIWTCKACKKQFSVKVGTIFEDSPLGLDKWLIAVWLIANCKNGVSTYEISRDLRVTQKSTWFMVHRIRTAMQDIVGGKLGGEAKADETFIGGKARNMHKGKWAKKSQEPNQGKAIVAAVLERGGSRVRASVVERRRKAHSHGVISDNVEVCSSLFSDDLQSYDGLSDDYQHRVVNHAEEYVNGNVHTNGIENFWSLLKRGLNCTYVSIEPFHLFRYIDEQAFRFNERKLTDAERFQQVCKQVVGRRLTWDRLTGKNTPDAQ